MTQAFVHNIFQSAIAIRILVSVYIAMKIPNVERFYIIEKREI